MANKSSIFRDLVVTFMFLLVVVGFVQAGTITVGPSGGHDFDTIQAGIDAANGGDTVLVAPGEYVINVPITFRGKSISVQSETGPDETTIRMGTPSDPQRASVVVFENNETDTSILEGFTITGGTGSRIPSGGGGILFDTSSGTVRDCAIVQNHGAYGGGVGCIYQCTPRLIDCIIAENSASGAGGGVFAWSGPSITLTNCIIRGNSASTISGGGILSDTGSSMIVIDCIVTENSAGEAGGGASSNDNSSLILTGCKISHNYAARHGPAVISWGRSSAILSNCIITKNSSGAEEGAGFCAQDSFMDITNCSITENLGATECGAVLCWRNASVTITNSVIWANEAPTGSEVKASNGGTIAISYSNVEGGQATALVESGGTINWNQGNIDANPLFADPSNDDFHLKSQAGRWNPESQAWVQDDVTSPCIDAGDPMSSIGWELFPNGGFVNMGANGGTSKASKSYFGEPVCEIIIAGDINGDGQVNQADLEIMALHWTDDEPLTLP